MSFNINIAAKYLKLKLRGKTIEKEKRTLQIPIEKDVNKSHNSEHPHDEEDSFFKNSKIIIPSRSSFFERIKPHTPTKTIKKEKKLCDSQTNTEPINKNIISKQNENNDKINCLITNNRINLKKYTSAIDNKKINQISNKIILNKKLGIKLIPPLVINQTHINSKNYLSDLKTYSNKIRNITSSGYRYKQNKSKNKLFDISSTFKNERKFKNIFNLYKRNLSNTTFKEKNFQIDCYAHNNRNIKIKNSNSKSVKSKKKNLISILDTNNSNKKNNNNLALEYILKRNFFQENRNLMMIYPSRKELPKKDSEKKFNSNFSFDEETKQKYHENDKNKFSLKSHNLNKKNIKFNPGKYSYPNKFAVVVNNNSLQETFKIQTVSNFNNKYNFKFKTKNPKEKEKIEELFDLLKLHKNSEDAKNTDFLSFGISVKKRNKKHSGKVLIENYTNRKKYNFENDKKGNKMISIKTLNFIEK